MELAQSDEDDVAQQSIEFWTSLAETENERMSKNKFVKQYIKKCYHQILPIILDLMQKIGDDIEDFEDDWGVALFSGCLIKEFAKVLKNEIVQPVIIFASDSIQKENWKQKYTGLVALGAILEGPEKIQLINIIQSGIPKLIGMIYDPNLKVQYAAAWFLSRVCEFCHEIIL